MPYKDFFQVKRVTLMGLGLLGRGIGDARFIASCGAHVLVTDLKSRDDLAPAIEELKDVPTIEYRLGEHAEKDFVQADMVLKAAGVRLNSPYIAAARKAGVPVYMSTALFAKFAREMGATIVGVTGTRGKTTTASLIYHALKVAGKSVHLGGNIRGRSTLEMLPQVKKGDMVVLELDSWQLQGFGDLSLSPDIAVFTNLMPDHLNYYKDMDEYFADKANIFKYQTKPQVIAGKEIAKKIPDAIVPERGEWKLQILGEHNIENASLAAEALRRLGLSEEEIKTGLESFEAVEGRLQFVREVRGVKIYNDNNATTPDATIAAIRALRPANIILIMGGADKGLSLQPLWDEILTGGVDVYFLAGSGIDRIRPEAPKVPIFNSITEVLDAALRGAQPGDTILFSPAFASFGLFKNEYDRNDQFLRAVQSLT